MQIIGCVVWVYISKEKRKKLDERSKKCYPVGYEGINIFRVWNPVTRKVKRTLYVDFDESRLMITAVSDTGYWLAEAIGDDVMDEVDVGGKAVHHPINVIDITLSFSNSIDTIQNIQNIIESIGDVGAAGGEVDQDSEEEVIEVLENGLETHPDPSPDAIYTFRLKRSQHPSQKVPLNEKWGDTKMWAQRAMAYTKCNKTLEAERLYCR